MKTVSNSKRISNGSSKKCQSKITSKLRDEVSRSRERYEEQPLDVRAILLQELGTLGLMLVHEELEREIENLVGDRYERTASP
ncbi:hypothetical protein ABTH99_18090, partial [Acinetobacter baumannii]